MNAKNENLYRIAVCDDEPQFLHAIKNLIEENLDKHGIEYVVEGFSSKEELEESLQEDSQKYDLIFLDIMLGDENGVQVAKEIRRTNSQVTIIFITVSPDFAIEGYEVYAFRYLIKPISSSVMEEVLLLDYKNREERSKKELIINIGSNVHRIKHHEIEYIEIKGRTTVIQTKMATLKTSYKIAELENLLSDSKIMRCHRSFLINLEHISAIQRYEAIVAEKYRIPISKAYFKDIKDAFMIYLSKS